MEQIDVLTNIIANFGFPIFLSCWLLIKTESSLVKISDNIKLLTAAVTLSSDKSTRVEAKIENLENILSRLETKIEISNARFNNRNN